MFKEESGILPAHGRLATKAAATEHPFMLVQGLPLVAVTLRPSVDFRIRSSFPAGPHYLLLSWSLKVWPSHEAQLPFPPRTEQLPQQQSKHIFSQPLPNGFWIESLSSPFRSHLAGSGTAEGVLLCAAGCYRRRSLTSLSSANDTLRDPIKTVGMAGGIFSSGPRCQSANPSLIHSSEFQENTTTQKYIFPPFFISLEKSWMWYWPELFPPALFP